MISPVLIAECYTVPFWESRQEMKKNQDPYVEALRSVKAEEKPVLVPCQGDDRERLIAD